MLRGLDAGTLRTPTKAMVRVAGVMQSLKRARVMDGDVLRTVAVFSSPLTVSANSVRGSGDGGEGVTITTNTSTAAVTGGVAPYTYAWTLVANGGGDPSTALAPATAGTTFRKTSVPSLTAYTDTWRVTVTDATGAVVSDDTPATFTNITTGGFD